MREALAGALIRLAHRIYRPVVTYKTPADIASALGGHSVPAGSATRHLASACIDAIVDSARRESRGWN